MINKFPSENSEPDGFELSIVSYSEPNFCDNEDKFSFTIDADYFIEPEFTNEVIEKLVLNS